MTTNCTPQNMYFMCCMSVTIRKINNNNIQEESPLRSGRPCHPKIIPCDTQSNILATIARYPTIQNSSNLDFNLSRSPKVTQGQMWWRHIGLSIYGFLYVLWSYGLTQRLNERESIHLKSESPWLNFSRSFTAKCYGSTGFPHIWLTIYVS